jgi:hypothetical protein
LIENNPYELCGKKAMARSEGSLKLSRAMNYKDGANGNQAKEVGRKTIQS